MWAVKKLYRMPINSFLFYFPTSWAFFMQTQRLLSNDFKLKFTKNRDNIITCTKIASTRQRKKICSYDDKTIVEIVFVSTFFSLSIAFFFCGCLNVCSFILWAMLLCCERIAQFYKLSIFSCVRCLPIDSNLVMPSHTQTHTVSVSK